MRPLLIILSLVLSLNCMASASMPSKCKDVASQVNRIDLIMFDKAKLIELGTCVGVELAKHNKLENLSEACDEVAEDKINPLGMLSLSKKEAVQMGLCTGVINYIYAHYDGEKYESAFYPRYQRYNDVYRCEKGGAAVNTLRNSGKTLSSREAIRDVLCKVSR